MIETFELADLGKTRAIRISDEAGINEMTRDRHVAYAWIADQLENGWCFYHPDEPTYLLLRQHPNPKKRGWTAAVESDDPTDVTAPFINLQQGLEWLVDDYFTEEELEDCLEALEFGNTVPIRKYMKKLP